jgi:predicted permease
MKFLRLRSLFRRDQLERTLDAEVRFHIDMETDKNVRGGMPRDQARRAAVAAFGNVGGVKDDVRDTWLVRSTETLWQDIRYGARTLRKAPGFTLVVVLTMALGIGANTAIFSVVNGVLLKPLPYERGDELVVLRQQRTRGDADDGLGFSPKEMDDYRSQASTLSGMVEFHDMWFILLGRPEPERVQTGVVSAGFFNVLGVKPLLGRNFREDDEKHGAPAVLILSFPYWQRSFGGDPNIVGQTFRMNDRPHTVVGVLPPIPQFPAEMDVYMPTTACPFRSNPRAIENRQFRLMRAFARTKSGVAPEQAASDLTVIAQRLKTAYPDAYPPADDFGVAVTPLRQQLTQQFKPTLVVLLATAGFVLLIVCASVANLLVARLVRRNRELAVRAALGAGRTRLLRQLLTESTMLAVAGGVVGLLLAILGLDLLVAFAERFTPRAAEITIDTPVLLFTLGMSVLTGLVFGAIPALGSRQDDLTTLRDGGTRVAGGRHAVRSTLVIAQVAVSFMLLIGAGLMLRSLMALQSINPGFSVENILTMRIDLNFSKYTNQTARASVIKRLLERLETEPGVSSVAASASFPLNDDGGGFNGSFEIEGKPVPDGQPRPRANLNLASPDYFKTIGIPLRKGRLFTKQDHVESPGVVIVSERLARRYWKDEDPIDRKITFNRGQQWLTIVGVVADARNVLTEEAGDVIYGPILQTGQLSTTWLIRTGVDSATMTQQVRAALREIDPEQPVDRFRTLEQVRASALAPSRLTTSLIGIFAALALTITAIGIGGVVAFSVSERVQEFGVRMALGAQRGEVLRMVLKQGVGMVAIGIALGVVGALTLTQLIANLLFGIEPTDVPTFIVVSVVLFVVALVACFLPARRAASVDPLVALRTVCVLLCVGVGGATAGAQTPAPAEALEGLDPVLLTQGKEVAGQDKLAVVHGRLTYFFSTAETKAAFEKDPAHYAVQLEGTCARMGPGVVGNPNLYAVHDGRIYLLGSPTCKERFEAAPAKYFAPLTTPLAPTPAEAKAARARLDKTATALGGLDRLTTYEERASRTIPAQGDMAEREMKTAFAWAVPHRLRMEMTFPDFGTVANVITDSDAFTALPKGVRTLDAPQVRDLMRQAFLHPLLLVRARESERFRAILRSPDVVDVQMLDGPVMTLKIDPSGGRPASVSYRGRGPEGDFGDVVITFSDYRDTNGVAVPFRRATTFNGEAVPQQSITIQSADVDKPMDDTRFKRPAS